MQYSIEFYQKLIGQSDDAMIGLGLNDAQREYIFEKKTNIESTDDIRFQLTDETAEYLEYHRNEAFNKNLTTFPE